VQQCVLQVLGCRPRSDSTAPLERRVLRGLATGRIENSAPAYSVNPHGVAYAQLRGLYALQGGPRQSPAHPLYCSAYLRIASVRRAGGPAFYCAIPAGVIVSNRGEMTREFYDLPAVLQIT